MSNYYRDRAIKLRDRKKLARSRVRKLRLNATKFEYMFRSKLKRAKIKHVFQKAFYDEWYFMIVDFYIPNYKVVFEIDGKQHWKNYDQIRKDAKHEVFLNKKKIRVIRIKNEDVARLKIKEIRKMIKG